MKYVVRLLLVILALHTLRLDAQHQHASTARFFASIRPHFKHTNLKVFDQGVLKAISLSRYQDLAQVPLEHRQRLFTGSRFFSPGMEGIYYYAYNDTYGDFYQLVLCTQGDYAPMLVLMNYNPQGRLVSEISVAGNFIDGGEAYLWNSEMINDAFLLFNHNSYYSENRAVYFCDSTLTTYAIHRHGSLKRLSETTYKVSTRTIGGAQMGFVGESLRPVHVMAPSGLKLRSRLDSRAKTLAVVPYGAELEVTFVSEQPFAIDWIHGNWVMARYGELEGYVFEGYLSALPAPDNRVPAACEGNYAALLREYVTHNFNPVSPPDSQSLNINEGEAYHLKVEQYFEDSLALSLHQYWDGYATELELPNRDVEEAYILSMALLSTCADADGIYDELLFVKNREGEIYKIYDRSGHLSILAQPNRSTLIRMNYQPGLTRN